jgi:anti-sigma regulatory factor (Ser/Thr protein kinase)
MGKSPQLVSIGAVSRELGLSPTRIRELTESGVFTALRTGGGHRRYDLEQTRAAWLRQRVARAGLGSQTLAPTKLGKPPEPTVDWVAELDGLEEDQVWGEISPRLSLDPSSAAQHISQYVFTEILNNAIDHSGGTRVSVRVWCSAAALVIEIGDNGVGAFRRLTEGKNLPDLFAAVSELTKGKQTTAPDRHTGEGIFFSSKAVDVFTLESNGITWIVDNLRSDYAVGSSSTTTGTNVRLEIDPHTGLDLGALFRQFTEDSQFTRTRPVVKLFGLGVTFVSRSEAKRLLSGMDEFTEVELDFTGVTSVGQGFVDEIFRVWPQTHPDTAVTPTNMAAAVEFMVRRARPTDPA